MDLNSFLITLKNKYNYDDNLLQMVGQIVPAMINYFGQENEEKIIKSFLDTPIKFVNDDEQIQDFANQVGIKGEYRMPTFASGGYEEYFQLNENGQVERIPFVLIRNHEMNDEFLNMCIHEFCHMVMNYEKTKVVDDKIISKTGLIEDEITIMDAKSDVKSSNVAFEEAINEYDAREITYMITGRRIENGNYGMYYSYITPLMENSDARQVIDQSRLNGDNTWQSVLGIELSEEYKNGLEDFVKINRNFSIPRVEKKALRDEQKQKMWELMQIVKEQTNEFKIMESKGRLS